MEIEWKLGRLEIEGSLCNTLNPRHESKTAEPSPGAKNINIKILICFLVINRKQFPVEV